MILASQIGLLFSLLGLAWRDFQDRLISITWFAAFGILAIVGWQLDYFHSSLYDVVANSSFLIVSLSGLAVYHKFRFGSFLGFVDETFGLGDLLFLALLVLVLPFQAFVLFFIISSLIVLLGSLIYQLVSKQETFTIPLAGGQAVLLATYFISKWWFDIDLLSFEMLML